MLNINNIISADAARTYYASADYYKHGQAQDFIGQWAGKTAERLGLTGPADIRAFDNLLRNRDPATGRSLTGSSKKDRRAGVDFTFSVPKSISALYAATEDPRLVAVMREAVRETMASIERHVMARVRSGKVNHDRVTGNMVWAEFVHFTTRPVNGIPDPQLHIHAVAPSLTWDEHECKWKSLQLEEFGKGGSRSQRPLFEAEFYSRLAVNLRHAGYGIRRTRHAFEIAGVPPAALDQFSRRSKIIKDLAAELGVSTGKGREQLAKTSREKKTNHLSWEELRNSWLSRLNDSDRRQLEETYLSSFENREIPGFDAASAVDHALKHWLVQQSVAQERDLLITAMKRGLGTATPEGIRKELAERDLVRATVDGRKLISTREVLGEEWAVLQYAQSARGRHQPLHRGGKIMDGELSAEQREAVRHVWESRDGITIIRGKAGTGKTRMMQEAVRGLKEAGSDVVVLAPSAEASRGVLVKEAGFKDATTVAEFLQNQTLQRRAASNVIWIDEAGMLGFEDMARVIAMAKQSNARLVLSGDRRQHRSVARGEPLAVLEDLGGLPVAELREIRRQECSDYKAAVELLADGQTRKGFEALDAMGAIKQMREEDKYEPLIADYLKALNDKKSVLVLSPTHKEGEAITEKLRKKLKQTGRLYDDDRSYLRLVPLHLTEAERSDPDQYEPGMVVQFFRHSGSYWAGRRVEVTAQNAADLARRASATQAFAVATVSLARGETIRITNNARTKDGKHRITNGSVYRIKSFTRRGDVVLDNGWTLDKNFGHWAPGYVLTSFGGQGKTVQRVLLALSAESYPAAGSRQLYVDASRGKESITIYTDDKEALKRIVQRQDPRLHAHDLLKPEAKRRWAFSARKFLEHARRAEFMQHEAQEIERAVELEHQRGGLGY